MEEKKYTEAGTDIDEVKKLNAASGISYNEALALLAQASEIQTADEIPLEPLRGNIEVDSNAYKNQVASDVPSSTHLDRIGPR